MATGRELGDWSPIHGLGKIFDPMDLPKLIISMG